MPNNTLPDTFQPGAYDALPGSYEAPTVPVITPRMQGHEARLAPTVIVDSALPDVVLVGELTPDASPYYVKPTADVEVD